MKDLDINYNEVKDSITDLKTDVENMDSCVEINDFNGVERDLDMLIEHALKLKNYLNKEPNKKYFMGTLENKGSFCHDFSYLEKEYDY